MNLSADGTRKVDVVTDSRGLMDADALAAALGGTVEDKDGRRAVRIDVPASGWSRELPAPARDLRAFDQLVIAIHTGGLVVRPSLWIELASRTSGLVHNDSFSSGRGAAIRHASWDQYPFPWENFLIFGMGDLVHPAERMKLSISSEFGPGPVWLAELRAEKRDRAEGPRLTDQGLLAELREGFADGRAYVTHLKARTVPAHMYGALPETPANRTPRTADDICGNFINGYHVGSPIDWRLNPNGYLEWMHAFNRHGWLNELLRAYRATGDGKYVRKLEEIWVSWIRANPEPIGHNGGGDPAWETLSAAVRIYGSWLNAFFALLHDENFSDAARAEVLKSFHGHAEHLLAHTGHANNWFIVESGVLFKLGLLLPEFRRAELWLAEGTRRLEQEIARQVFPDGADWELSVGYHQMACRGFLEAYELAQLNGLPLPAIFAERLPKTFEYSAGMTRPDGTLAAVNDSGGCRSRERGGFLHYGARLFHRDDLLAGPEGPFAGRSRAFPDAGFHILASGRGHEALWSLMDCGLPGASHRHDDALSVEVFAFGSPFIVDPGITGYLKDRWTEYYRRTDSHNTGLVGGARQNASAKLPSAYSPSARGRAQWAPGESVDFVRCTYDGGYEGLGDGVTHTRAILFVRGRYWVLFDEVAGGAADMEARFQFVPLRMVLDRGKRTFRTLRQNRPNLELIVAAPRKGLKLSIACGQADPVGGWISDGEDLPAPQARIGVKRGGAESGDKLRLVTVIYPFASGVSSGVKVKATDESAGVTALELRAPGGGRETVLYSWDGGPINVKDTRIVSPVGLVAKRQALVVDGARWRAV